MNDKERETWLRQTIQVMPHVKLAVCRSCDWSIYVPGMKCCPICLAFAMWWNEFREMMG